MSDDVKAHPGKPVGQPEKGQPAGHGQDKDQAQTQDRKLPDNPQKPSGEDPANKPNTTHVSDVKG